MGRKFVLKRGMFLIISRVLEFETPEIIAYGFDYEQVWNHWVKAKDCEWDLAQVITHVVNGREIHQVWRVTKPIPPSRYKSRLAARKQLNP